MERGEQKRDVEDDMSMSMSMSMRMFLSRGSWGGGDEATTRLLDDSVLLYKYRRTVG